MAFVTANMGYRRGNICQISPTEGWQIALALRNSGRTRSTPSHRCGTAPPVPPTAAHSQHPLRPHRRGANDRPAAVDQSSGRAAVEVLSVGPGRSGGKMGEEETPVECGAVRTHPLALGLTTPGYPLAGLPGYQFSVFLLALLNWRMYALACQPPEISSFKFSLPGCPFPRKTHMILNFEPETENAGILLFRMVRHSVGQCLTV